ncbi:MAG: ABC transporter substrate-binding protein/permease [Coriobacteriales bacterium]|jgi:polar amino acid transport system substrate-binding protein|nr:ABC transporter substrate-binding protein/permease [Coriobacteriales bacterium]
MQKNLWTYRTVRAFGAIRTPALISALVLVLSLATLSLNACTAEQSQTRVQSLDDMATARIGIFEGSIYDQVVSELYPDATKLYYKTAVDILTALQSGQVDCMLVNKVSADRVMREVSGIRYLDEYLGYEDLAPVVSPDKAYLRDELNTVIAEMENDGTLADLQQKWLYGPVEEAVMGEYELSGEKGTLSLATGSDNTPFALVGENGEIVGYDIEFMMLFAERQGYALETTDMNFAGMLAAISVGKYDVAATGITITPERAEVVLFSNPTARVPMVCLVHEGAPEVSSGPLDVLGRGIQSTFIDEGRYRLLLSGLGITLGITALSAVLGTALGALFFCMKRSKLRGLRVLTSIVDRLTNGLPTVVILLVLAYVVFSAVPIAGFWVACIGFSLIFASGFSETMLVGTNSVSRAQTEAALALGFSRGEVFRLVVLPQAMSTIVPLYSGQLAELVKGTAIVGFIAVDDLTRASDLIRSVTFDALFPLMASAVVYFLVIWLLVAGLRGIQRQMESGRTRRARQSMARLEQGAPNLQQEAGRR